MDKSNGQPMNIPVIVLLGFAAWTLLTLFSSIGVCRRSRILTGRTSIAEWWADLLQGSDWYQRAIRAHMNCVENLPVYTAIVVALIATGVKSAIIDTLAVALLGARVGQRWFTSGCRRQTRRQACESGCVGFLAIPCAPRQLSDLSAVFSKDANEISPPTQLGFSRSC